MNMPHLLVDISAHGFGHVSQTAPVVNELVRRVPGLRVTLRSAAPLPLLRQRFSCDFDHIQVALDFGMNMANAVDVEVGQSAAAYRAFHANWDQRVRLAAAEISALKPDLLLANVPYLSLAAARVAGVRSAAMCCLNWADIYSHYCHGDADSAVIHAQMLAAYDSAEVFLKVQPTMPMLDLGNAQIIGPIAQVGRSQRAQIEASLLPPPGRGRAGEGVGTSHFRWSSAVSTPILSFPLPGGRKRPGSDVESDVPAEKLILVAMGGIDFRLPMENWPRLDGVRWLVPQAWHIVRDDIIAFEPLGLPFGDLLASCDAVFTKPGYGTFVEAACASVPVLYVSRGDWPEEPYLVQWLQQHGVCRVVGRERLQGGDLEDVLRDLWSHPKPPVPEASGAAEAAEILAGKL